MRPLRQVALLFDPHRLDRHARELLAGVRSVAQRVPHWRCTFDPDAADHLPGPYHGLIAAAGPTAAARIQRVPLPAVFVTWRAYTVRPLARVVENRMAAGRLAAAHLLEQGYRAFAYLGLLQDTASRLERADFRGWVRRRGRPLSICRIPALYRSADQWRQLLDTLDQWLDRLTPPVGIYATSDLLARTLADRARRKGLRIPDDLGLIGAGNDPVVCDLPRPSLTSIEFHYPRVGARAAELLDRLMDGEPPSRRALVIKPTLVPRASTDRGRLDDPLVAQAVYWIRTHSNEPIRTAHVAEAVGLSQRQLQRRIRRTDAGTIAQAIVRARLDHAKVLLEMGGDSPAAIARETGFGTRRHLSRVFRDHEGCTPTDYRLRHKRPPRPADRRPAIIFLGPPGPHGPPPGT